MVFVGLFVTSYHFASSILLFSCSFSSFCYFCGNSRVGRAGWCHSVGVSSSNKNFNKALAVLLGKKTYRRVQRMARYASSSIVISTCTPRSSKVLSRQGMHIKHIVKWICSLSFLLSRNNPNPKKLESSCSLNGVVFTCLCTIHMRSSHSFTPLLKEVMDRGAP